MFGKKKDLSGYKLYDLCNSQDGMYLMYKFNLQKQQVQIPTSITVDRDLDFDLLQKAFDMEIERNESFRIRFVKVKGAVKQYFIEPYTFKVERKHFSSVEEQEAFFDSFPDPADFFKWYNQAKAEYDAIIYHYEGGTVAGRPWQKGSSCNLYTLWDKYKDISPWIKVNTILNV